jgi:transposase
MANLSPQPSNMDLTEQQWRLVRPVFPSPRQSGRGRPPSNLRLILNGVLWKLRTASPWYDLPECYPAWQTCYQYYRRWKNRGLIDEIHRLLYQDLRQRGGLDLFHSIQEGTLPLVRQGSRYHLRLPTELQDSWQYQTAQLLFQYIIVLAKNRMNLEP